MKKKILLLFLIISSLFCVACSKPNTSDFPELLPDQEQGGEENGGEEKDDGWTGDVILP